MNLFSVKIVMPRGHANSLGKMRNISGIIERGRPTMATPEQRVNAAFVAGFTGIPASTIIKLAQQGRMPATKIGRRWTFSPSRIEQWIKEKEDENLCRIQLGESQKNLHRIALKEGMSGGRRSSFLVSDTDKAYARMMRGKRRAV
ncbi:helix-turn-helix domain-containing protein [Bombella sp. ESL0385]|nr:helix-turn-helix domain-containing protein [Bombella sp. ESL0385]